MESPFLESVVDGDGVVQPRLLRNDQVRITAGAYVRNVMAPAPRSPGGFVGNCDCRSCVEARGERESFLRNSAAALKEAETRAEQLILRYFGAEEHKRFLYLHEIHIPYQGGVIIVRARNQCEWKPPVFGSSHLCISVEGSIAMNMVEADYVLALALAARANPAKFLQVANSPNTWDMVEV